MLNECEFTDAFPMPNIDEVEALRARLAADADEAELLDVEPSGGSVGPLQREAHLPVELDGNG